MSSAILSHLHDDSNLVVENVVSCCIQQVSLVARQPLQMLYHIVSFLRYLNSVNA